MDISRKRTIDTTAERVGMLSSWCVFIMACVTLYFGVGWQLFMPFALLCMFLYAISDVDVIYLTIATCFFGNVAYLSSYNGYPLVGYWCTVIALIVAFNVFAGLAYRFIVSHVEVGDKEQATFDVDEKGNLYGWDPNRRWHDYCMRVYGKTPGQLEAIYAAQMIDYSRIVLTVAALITGFFAYGFTGFSVAFVFAIGALLPPPQIALPGWLYDRALYSFLMSLAVVVPLSVSLMTDGHFVPGAVALVSYLVGILAASLVRYVLYLPFDLDEEELESAIARNEYYDSEDC